MWSAPSSRFLRSSPWSLSNIFPSNNFWLEFTYLIGTIFVDIPQAWKEFRVHKSAQRAGISLISTAQRYGEEVSLCSGCLSITTKLTGPRHPRRRKKEGYVVGGVKLLSEEKPTVYAVSNHPLGSDIGCLDRPRCLLRWSGHSTEQYTPSTSPNIFRSGSRSRATYKMSPVEEG